MRRHTSSLPLPSRQAHISVHATVVLDDFLSVKMDYNFVMDFEEQTQPGSPGFSQLNLSSPAQDSSIVQQFHEPYSLDVALEPTMHWHNPGWDFPMSMNHIPPSIDRTSTIRDNEHGSLDPENRSLTRDTISMGPPVQKRKKKAPTLRAKDWEPHKAQIIQLHVKQGLPLPEVKKRMEGEFGFVAELRQYRTRISQWKEDKNVKHQEMAAIVRKRQQRKLIDSHKRELMFTVRGKLVEPQKIDRWMKRNDVPESFPYAPSPVASTPSAIECQTISELGSPVPISPRSVASPAFTFAGFASIPQLSRSPSPAISITSIIQAQDSGFAGQSPTPTYRTLRPLILEAIPLRNTLHIMPGSELPPPTYRFRQLEEEHLKTKLSYAEIVHGEDREDTLKILSQLALIFTEQGRYKSAEEMVRRELECRQRTNGPNDPNTLIVMQSLGEILWKQGRYDQGERVFRRTFASLKMIMGLEHPSTLQSMNSLGVVLNEKGKYAEAVALHIENIALSRKVLGEEHPLTICGMLNLGRTYSRQGKWQDAEKLQLQVMGLSEKALGAESLDTLSNMGNLGVTYSNQGRWKDAEELQLRAVEMGRKLFGSQHPFTLIAMQSLEITYSRQSRWKEAEELQVQILEARKKVLGNDHPETLNCLVGLGVIYSGQGRLQEAERMQVEVLEMFKKLLGQDSLQTLGSMQNLAITYSQQGRLQEAEEIQSQVLEIRKRQLGQEHPDTIRTMQSLAVIYSQWERLQEAEEMQLQALELFERAFGAEHPDTQKGVQIMSMIYRKQGRLDEAEILGG